MEKKTLWVLPVLVIAAGCSSTAPPPDSASTTDQPASARSAIVSGEKKGVPGEQKGLLGKIFARSEDVTIPAGTPLRVRLGESIDTRTNRAGDAFTATLDAPVAIGEQLVLPKGTPFSGRVTTAAQSGRLKGRAQLGLTLDSFQHDGKTYSIDTGSVARASSGHKKRNWVMIGGGSGVGAAIGAIAGGGTGALIGAGAGAAAGTAGAAATGKQNVTIPVETPLTFALDGPVVVKVTKS